MTCLTTAEAHTARAAAPAASWVGELRLLVDAQVIGSLKKKRTLVESEGNGRMCLTLPETLISVVGIEKTVPTWQDLEVFLQSLPRSSTAERMNPYTSMWTGTADAVGATTRNSRNAAARAGRSAPPPCVQVSSAGCRCGGRG